MEEHCPRFSLLLPAYNAEKTLSRAIESVLIQEFEDWELIIVDDGSTDDTLSVARRFATTDRRIRLFSQNNEGCDGARARAQRESHGRLLMKVDADDELTPDCLVVMDGFIDAHPGFDIYSCNGYFYASEEKGNPPRPFLTTPRFLEVTSVTYEDMLEECWLLGGGSCVTRELVASMGGYRRGFRTEDYDMWMRALARGARHIYTPQCLYRYHFGTQGHMNEDQTISYESFVRVLEDVIASGVLGSERLRATSQAVEHYRERTTPDFMDKVIVNAHMQDQAGAIYRFVSRVVPHRLVPATMRVLYILRKPLTPLRMMLAKRQTEKAQSHVPTKRSEGGGR